MTFFEQIGRHLTDAGQNVSQQTKNLAETARLNSSISEKEKMISELFTRVGQTYYEKHKDDTSAEEQDLINEINVLQSEIFQCREKIKIIKGVVKCTKCGADIPVNDTFCSTCGTRVIREEFVKSKGTEERKCAVCGEIIAENNLFCTHCGAKAVGSKEE